MEDVRTLSIISKNELSREGLRRIFTAEGFDAGCLSYDDPGHDEFDGSDHVVLVDLDDEVQGVKYCSTLRDTYPLSRIILMCPQFRGETIWAGFERGIDGFLLRSMSYEMLLCKISLVAAGERVMPSSSINELIEANGGRPLPSPEPHESLVKLSEREKGILRCLVDGNPNKVISRRLSIAEPTVKVHVKAILHKLQLSNRTQAAIWAVNNTGLS